MLKRLTLIVTLALTVQNAAADTLTADIGFSFLEDSHRLQFTITPSVTDQICVYNFYASRRRRRLRKLPRGAISIATFGKRGVARIEASNLEPLHVGRQAKKRKVAYFRMMIRCNGEKGFSKIYRRRLPTAHSQGLKGVKAWILTAKYNMAWAEDETETLFLN